MHGGVNVDLRRGGGLTDDDWWPSLYEMLSRVQKLSNMLLIGFTEHVEELLRRGPPSRLIAVTDELKQRAQMTLPYYS